MKKILFLLLFVGTTFSLHAQKSPDAELLGRALDYFASQKYGEALSILAPLDKRYKLNDRFRAYIGLCYYYEWDYKQAAKYFEATLPQLSMLSPHELSVYRYAAGESYFQMEAYDKALAHFEQDLTLCYENEKGDVLYRIGLCHMKMEHWQEAIDAYSQAERYLSTLRNPDDVRARRAQIENMRKGCITHVNLQFLKTCEQTSFLGNSPIFRQTLAMFLMKKQPIPITKQAAL